MHNRSTYFVSNDTQTTTIPLHVGRHAFRVPADLVANIVAWAFSLLASGYGGDEYDPDITYSLADLIRADLERIVGDQDALTLLIGEIQAEWDAIDASLPFDQGTPPTIGGAIAIRLGPDQFTVPVVVAVEIVALAFGVVASGYGDEDERRYDDMVRELFEMLCTHLEQIDGPEGLAEQIGTIVGEWAKDAAINAWERRTRKS